VTVSLCRPRGRGTSAFSGSHAGAGPSGRAGAHAERGALRDDTGYTLMLARLDDDRRRLKTLESIEIYSILGRSVVTK